jgi:hypothetical protein
MSLPNTDIIPFKNLSRYKKRLLALADHIEAVPQDLFDMESYRLEDDTLEGCGTVGCALGHAPALLIKRFHVRPASITMTMYSEIVIDWDKVALQFGITDDVFNSPAMAYLFHALWKHVDNTPTGAAKRIRWVVKHGGVPFNYSQQIFGEAPRSYEQAQVDPIPQG